MKTELIYEDNDIIVCRKPAGLPTQTSRISEPDVVSELKNYLGKPYLAVVHRLDQPVEGLLVFGKNQKAGKKLSQELTEHSFQKSYYAVSLYPSQAEEGILEDYMIKDGQTAKIVTADTPSAKRALLHYRALSTIGGRTLYEIRLETGRFHQIRAQMAHAGMALLGDRKYGGETEKEYAREHGIRTVSLCAFTLQFTHPATGERKSFVIQPEGEVFREFFSRM